MRKIKSNINPVYLDNPQIVDFIEEVPSAFDKDGDMIYNKRNRIKSFNFDSTDKSLDKIIVKRYKLPNNIQRIVYSFFRKSKAFRAFHNAMELENRGVETPQAIAYIEEWENFLFKYGYYISKSDDSPPIRDRLIEPENFDTVMAEDFAGFAALLHEKGILHNDLNSTNVLYHENNGRYTFSVIDINRMQFYPQGSVPSRKDCYENLTRFTGRMDLFEYVLRVYARKRNWDVEQTVNEAIEIKNRHDEQWRRRKQFFRRFKFKKKQQ